MDRPAGPLGRHAASLRAGAERIARAIDTAVMMVVAELRRLNGLGANAASRSDRVRLVKQALARRGQGPNRCC